MFISNDPLQRRTREMVRLGELNGYRYVKNNPMKFVDPTGEVTTNSDVKLSIANPAKAWTVNNIVGYVNKIVGEKFDSGFRNGPADAFRHALWNAIMTKELGKEWAKKFGDAHEDWSENPELEKQMDLYNNEKGRDIGEKYIDDQYNWEDIATAVEEALKNGKLQTQLNENSDNNIENEQYYDDGYYYENYKYDNNSKGKYNYDGSYKEYESDESDYNKSYEQDYKEKRKKKEGDR